MKKIFVEPEVVRIDLRMTENIAASKPRYFQISMGNNFAHLFATQQYVDRCIDFVAETRMSLNEFLAHADAGDVGPEVINTCNIYVVPELER